MEHEAGAIQSLRQIAKTQGTKGAAVEDSLQRCVEISLTEEWIREDTGRSTTVDDALERLVTAILDPALSADTHRTAQAAMLESYRDIRRARAELFHVLNSHSDPFKWAAVLLLGLLTHAAIALVHIGNRRAQCAALVVFTTAFVITLAVLVSHESPLADHALISPEPNHRLAR